MKRWMRFQQTMNKKRWFELDREKNGPITLFDFSTPEDAYDAAMVEEDSDNRAVWRATNDSIIGGYSRAKIQFVRTVDDYQNIMNGREPMCASRWDQENGSHEQNESDGQAFVPFIRWKGNISTKVNKEAKVQRSGFCTILSPEFPMGGVDLGGRYNGIEIMCRSDGRPYSLNLKVESFIADDLFQCFIKIPPTIASKSETYQTTGGEFDQVVFLFQHFVATAGGRLRARQRSLDNSIKIQSIGITLMDGNDGDFQFDLSRIRAINFDETGVIGEAD